MSAATLGERNNNLLNIRYSSANDWLGQIGENKGFAVFSNPILGLRAGDILTKNYGAQGYNTVDKFINKYAPPTENDTENYINRVIEDTGYDRDEILDLSNRNVRLPLLKSLVKMETGVLLDDQDIIKAQNFNSNQSLVEPFSNDVLSNIAFDEGIKTFTQGLSRPERDAVDNGLAAFTSTDLKPLDPLPNLELGERDVFFAKGDRSFGELFSDGVTAGFLGAESLAEEFKIVGNSLIGNEKGIEDDLKDIQLYDALRDEALSGVPDFTEFLDQPTVGGFIEQFVKFSGQSLPYVAETVASALLTGGTVALGKAALSSGGRGAFKSLVKRTVEKAARKESLTPDEEQVLQNSYDGYRALKLGSAFKKGATAGAFLTSYKYGVAESGAEFREVEGDLTVDRGLQSLALGVPRALIETAGQVGIFKSAIASLALKEGQRTGSRTLTQFGKDFASQFAKIQATETTTETLQESIGVAQRFAIDPTYTKEQAALRLAETAFGAFAGASPIGATIGAGSASVRAAKRARIFEKSKDYINKVRETKTEADIYNEETTSAFNQNSEAESRDSLNAQLKAAALPNGKSAVWIDQSSINVAKEADGDQGLPSSIGDIDLTNTDTIQEVTIDGTTMYVKIFSSSRDGYKNSGILVSRDKGKIETARDTELEDKDLSTVLEFTATKPSAPDSAGVVQIVDSNNRVLHAQEVDAEQLGNDEPGPAVIRAQNISARINNDTLDSPYSTRVETVTTRQALTDRKIERENRSVNEVGDLFNQVVGIIQNSQNPTITISQLQQVTRRGFNNIKNVVDELVEQNVLGTLQDDGTYQINKEQLRNFNFMDIEPTVSESELEQDPSVTIRGEPEQIVSDRDPSPQPQLSERRAPGTTSYQATDRENRIDTDPVKKEEFETKVKEAESLIILQNDPDGYISVPSAINFAETGELNFDSAGTTAVPKGKEKTANNKYTELLNALIAVLKKGDNVPSTLANNLQTKQNEYFNYIEENKSELTNTRHAKDVEQLQRELLTNARDLSNAENNTFVDDVTDVTNDLSIPDYIKQDIINDLNTFRSFKNLINDALINRFLNVLRDNQRQGAPNYVYLSYDESAKSFNIISQPKDVLFSDSIAIKAAADQSSQMDSYNTTAYIYKLVDELIGQDAKTEGVAFILKGPATDHQGTTSKRKTLKSEGETITLGKVVKYGKDINIATKNALVGDNLTQKQANVAAFSRALAELKKLGYTIEVKDLTDSKAKPQDIFEFFKDIETAVIDNKVGTVKVEHVLSPIQKVKITNYRDASNGFLIKSEIGHTYKNNQILLAGLKAKDGITNDFELLNEMGPGSRKLFNVLNLSLTYEQKNSQGQIINQPFTLYDYFFTSSPKVQNNQSYVDFIEKGENLYNKYNKLIDSGKDETFQEVKDVLKQVDYIKTSNDFQEWYVQTFNQDVPVGEDGTIPYSNFLQKRIMQYIGAQKDRQIVKEATSRLEFEEERDFQGDFNPEINKEEAIDLEHESRKYDGISQLQYNTPSNKKLKTLYKNIYKAHNIVKNWSRKLITYDSLKESKYNTFNDFATKAFNLLKLNTPQHVILLSDLINNKDNYVGFFRDTYGHFDAILQKHINFVDGEIKNRPADKALQIFKEILEAGEVTESITKKYSSNKKDYKIAVNRFQGVIDESLAEVSNFGRVKVQEIIDLFERRKYRPLGINTSLGDSNLIVLRDFERDPKTGDPIFNKPLDERVLVPVLAHELGHSYVREAIDSLTSTVGGPNKTILNNIKNNFEQKKKELEDVGITEHQYFGNTGFNEFIADQVALWLKGEVTKVSDRSQVWYKQIANRLKQLFTFFRRVIPNPTSRKVRFTEDPETQRFITATINKLKFNHAVNRKYNQGVPGISTNNKSLGETLDLYEVQESAKRISAGAIAYSKLLGKKLLQTDTFKLAAKYLAATDNYFRTLGPGGVKLAQFFHGKSQSQERAGFHANTGNAQRRFVSAAENALGATLKDGNEWTKPKIKETFDIAEDENLSNDDIKNMNIEEDVKQKVIKLRVFLDKIFNYASRVPGMEIRKRSNFFPRQLAMLKIMESEEAQTKLFNILIDPETNKAAVLPTETQAADIIKKLIDEPLESGTEVANILDQRRSKDFDGISTKTLRDAGLLEEAPQALLSYIHFITRKTEFERKGGKEVLDKLVEEVVNDKFGPEFTSRGTGVIPPQYIDEDTGDVDIEGFQAFTNAREKFKTEIQDAINKQFGRVSPLPSYMRQFNSISAVTTVMTTLLFTVFASLPDLGAVILRQKSFSNLVATFKENQKLPYEEKVELARAVGAATFDGLEAAFTAVGEMDFANTWARSTMKTWFKYTGLSWWTRYTRVFAASMGRSYIIHLGKVLSPDSTYSTKEKEQAQRWLSEFPGLELNDILTWNSADPTVDNNFGFDTPEGEKIRDAIARYVDESIIRPNPSQRPNWANNPWFSILFQLKQFFYSYGKVVIGGAGREIKNRYTEDGHFGGGASLMLLAAGTMLPLAALGIELKELAKYLLQLGLGPFIPNELLGVREAGPGTFRSDFTPTGQYTFELIEKAGWLGPLSMGVMAANSNRWGDNAIIGSIPMADAMWDTFGKGELVRLIPVLNNIK